MTKDGVPIGMCRKRYFEIASSNTQVRICPDCTIEKLRTHVLKSLAVDIAHSVPSVTEHLYIGNEYKLARCDEGKMRVKDCLDAFENGAETFAFVMLNNLADKILIGEGKGLSFFFHSNESPHNNPHVHVNYKHECQELINILTGEMEARCLPRKVKREAVEIILRNRDKQI